MMKTIIISILIIFIFVNKALSQHPYYDAFVLKGYTKNGVFIAENRLQIDTILSRYIPNADENISSTFGENPFIKQFFPRGVPHNLIPGMVSDIPSLIGGLEIPSNILLGVTDFIIKRSKQELSVAFFDRFKKVLSDTNYIDLQTVFPQTYKNLLVIGDEIYQYEAYIHSLRESFRKDIDNLNSKLPTIIENHPEFWKKHKEWKAAMQSAFYLSDALSDKEHPGDILLEYPSEYLDSLNTNWKGAIQTLQLISASIRDTIGNKDSAYWVSSKQVRKLVTDSIAFRIYLGLIYQQAKSKTDTILFINSAKRTQPLLVILDTVALNYKRDYTAFGNFIAHVGEKTNKINTLLATSITKKDSDSTAIQRYYDFYIATLNLLEQCTEISTLPYFKKIVPNLSDSLKGYFDIARTTANLVMDIKLKSYSSAIVNAAHIYDLVKANPAKNDLPKSLSSSQKKKAKQEAKKNKKEEHQALNLDKKKTNPQIAPSVVTEHKDTTTNGKNGQDLKETNNKGKKEEKNVTKLEDFSTEKEIIVTGDQLFKLGSFMATMVTAKSPEDVENAIEAIALPAGSSRIKRETSFNISLNSYAGLFAGNEVIKGTEPDKFINTFGLAVPIGISISRGHRILPWPLSELNCFETTAGWSSSLFISIVDLGAVAAFRIANDSIDQVPTIQLQDIFSPGIFWSLGIPKSPISLNVGLQVGPNLRKVESEMNDYSNNTYIRFSTSVCVDLPMINLYTRSRLEEKLKYK